MSLRKGRSGTRNDKEAESAWAVGGGVGGGSRGGGDVGGSSEWGEEAHEDAPRRGAGAGRRHVGAYETEAVPVPVVSMSAFIAPAAAPAQSGNGAWDPFSGGGDDAGSGATDEWGAPAPAPVVTAPAPARKASPAPAPAPAKSTAFAPAPSAPAALKAKVAAPAPAPTQAAPAFDPFGDAFGGAPATAAAAAPAARGVTSLADDLSGLNFDGPSTSASRGPTPAAADPFGGDFGAPAAKPIAAAAKPASSVAASSLVDLDNLNAPKATAPASNRPSLSQLAQKRCAQFARLRERKGCASLKI